MKNHFSDSKSPDLKSRQSGEAGATTPSATNDAASSFEQRVLLIALAIGLVCAILILLAAPSLREWAFAALPESKFSAEIRTADLKKLRQEAQRVERRVTNLQRRFEWLTPRQPYLIVDTSDNRFYVLSDKKILHEGICSTGSYVLLKAADQRQWVFVTPRGMLRILGKKEAPVWYKPDWAFVEEGLPVPPPYSSERYEAGVLGEYALELGDGYLIHGTLYKRMLGMPVTHGCVRLDDEDLRIVYQNLQVGSKVFIY
jgi:hypothetical protein